MGFVNACQSAGARAEIIYAGSLYGGLWKGEKNSSDDTSFYQWKNISDSWKIPGTGIAALAVDEQSNKRVIYIGTHQGGNGRLYLYGNGILKSENEGKTWTQVGPSIKPQDRVAVDYMKMCPEDHQIMFARIGKKYFITRNGWKTFDSIFPPIKNKDENLHIADIEWKPGNKEVFYLSTRSESGIQAELMVTENLGKTWKDLQHGIKAGNIQMAVVNKPGMENLLFIAYANNGAYIQLYDGKIWSTNKNKNRIFSGSGYWNMQFEVNEADTSLIYLSMTQIARSKNGGKTFETITEYLGVNTHADVRDLHLIQSSTRGEKDVLLMANDGGVSLSEEGIRNSKSWKNCNGKGLSIAQFWGIGTADTSKEMIAGGGQDNGLYTYREGKWHTNIAGIGDGYEVCISELNSEYLLGQGNSPTVHRSENSGESWRSFSSPNSKAGNFRRPLLQDKTNHRIYIGHHQLFVLDNSSGKLDGAWIQKSQFPDVLQKNGMLQNNLISAIGLNGKNKEKCLIAYEGPLWGADALTSKLFFTQNVGGNSPEWIDLTRYLPQLNWREIYDIVGDENDYERFFLLCQDPYNGFESEVIQLDIPSSADTVYATDITGNLPKIPRSKLLSEGNGSGNLYAGSDSGIYFTNSKWMAEKKWEKLEDEKKLFPFCTISDMEFNAYQNKIYIATYGRGVWSSAPAVAGKQKKITIRKNTIWNEPKKIDGKLVVNRGKILELSHDIFISEFAGIELQSNAKIVLMNHNQLRTNNGDAFDEKKIRMRKGAAIIRENR